MSTLIAALIHSSQGYSHETAGVIVGFFDDPEKARRARKMVFERGGDIISLIPHKGSLEDLFYEEVKKGGRQ